MTAFQDAVAYEDNHLLAANKPPGVPSQPDASGDASFIEMAKAYVKEKYGKPGDVYLALLHRLDRPASGLILMARTEKAAGRLSGAFRDRTVGKTYLAAVECPEGVFPPEEETPLVNYLREKPGGGVRVFRAAGEGRKRAELSFRAVRILKRRAVLGVRLVTGVKHQIRAQLAFAGFPVVGDFRYGVRGAPARPERVMDGRAVMLHSLGLEFEHPVRREGMALAAPLPPFWEALGLLPP